MINAKEALELYEQSDVEIEKYLKILNEDVITSAKAGKRVVEHFVNACDVHEKENITPSQLHIRVIDRLRMLGYNAEFESFGDSYIPRAYEDSPNPPRYCNYGIVIKW
jgi:hypothetical protein